MGKYPSTSIQLIRIKQHGICLLLSLLLLISLAGQAVALDGDPPPSLQLRSEQVFLYEGIDLSTGLTEIDPSLLTILLGASGEVKTISAPALTPLFTFSDWVDLYFGLSGDPEHPVLLVAQNIKGLAVVKEITLETFETLELIEDPPAVAINNEVIVVILTIDDTYIFLGDVVLQPDMSVRFEYLIEKDPTPDPNSCCLEGELLVS